MPLDTADYISELDAALPNGNDPVAEGNDNFQHVKQVLLNSFPNVGEAVTLTSYAINNLPVDITVVDDRLTSEAARLDTADTDNFNTLTTDFNAADDVVRGEFAAADTATQAAAEAAAAADASAKDDALRGDLTSITIRDVQNNLEAHQTSQSAVDGAQDASIASIQSQLADLGAGDTDLDLAKQYTDQAINALRGEASPGKTVLANYNSIQTNTGNISTLQSDVSDNTGDINSLESRVTALENSPGGFTMQEIVDTVWPVGSHYMCEYNKDIPNILKQYGTWSTSSTFIIYVNASKNNTLSIISDRQVSNQASGGLALSKSWRVYLRTA